MRVPLSWLGRHVDIDGVSVDELSEQLTFAGAEIEHVDRIGALSPDAVLGRILSVEAPRPDLRYFLVEVGRGDPVTVVSKAPNLLDAAAGTAIAVALPGVSVFTRKDDGSLALKAVSAKETWGRLSQAVGCSDFELGIGPDHGGVRVLDSKAAPGTPVSQLVALPEGSPADCVLTLAILPNIARCQSVLGVAREVGALRSAPTRLDVKEAQLDFISDEALNPTSDDAALCDRFAVALVQGVVVGPSPEWMQARLLAAGLQPINNVVDASNFVMVELGQPTHAYDADRLPSLKLHVRPSGPDEAFKPLTADDDAPASLLPGGLPLIVSNGQPVAQAGVMGGFETQVTESSTRLLLESAHFDPIAVRRSQAATLTYSESSARFSRGTDPAGVERAIRRILALLSETCPDLQVVGTGLWAPVPLPQRSIVLDADQLNAALGLDLPRPRIAELLKRAGFGLDAETAEGPWTVSVPSFRGDVEGPHDLHEEVARLEGYDRMPATMPVEPVPQRPQPRDTVLRRQLEDALVAAGLHQTVSYSLTSPEAEDRLFAGLQEAPERAYTTLLNPTSQERRVMRRSLLGHLVEHARDNLRHGDAAHLFEIGPVFHPEASTDVDGLPAEPLMLAVVMVGAAHPATLHAPQPPAVDFFDLAAALDQALGALHAGGLSRSPTRRRSYHPRICGALSLNGQPIGHLGALHPAVATAFDLDGRQILAAEIRLEPVLSAASDSFFAPGPPRFPGIDLDLSLLMDGSVTAGAVLDVARQAGGPLLQGLTVFDVYRGKGVPAGQQALGLRLQVRDDARTLRMEEAEAVRDAVVAALGAALQASLRG